MDDENDKAIDAIENQVSMLQDKLKDRLEETQSIDSLSKKVSENTFHLERSTQNLEKTSIQTRWLMQIKLYKWYIAIGIVVLLMLVMIRNSFK